MSNQLFLRPAEGLKVRHPDGRRLAEAGETVTLTSYWERRIAAGDVIVGAEQKAAAPKGGEGRANTKGNRE